ncbi:hypothetical protein [Fibrobacter sp.]|nr:hypothetical protein [Fibrobacter sp.]
MTIFGIKDIFCKKELIMANESQDDLISAADVASPIQLQQDE